ncbi:AraC family transcriptional regulator [Bacillus sp. FJAT-28004]|uniref:AraC family transcriptional regulator n=1 Tax=Bacillus sp. FJAT-28004 TaxID=1679165 RepID=UPI0006B53EBD|nr:AraC family transcriptional regulator [Bacillus sp. FJAT-28004]
MDFSFKQPHTRMIDTRAFAPSIHWAEHQNIPPVQGLTRRLYDGELMYVYMGCIAVHFEDSAEPITFYSGDLLILPPAVKHRIVTMTSPNVRLLGIHFDLYDELDIEFDGDMVVSERQVKEESFCFWPNTADGRLVFARCYRSVPQEIVRLMEDISRSYQISKSDSFLVCRGYMQLILATLLSLPHESERQSSSAYEKLLFGLKVELQQNIHLPYTNKTMAQRLNVSEDHFIRLFKQTFDMSPQKYLQDLRHQAAKRYLRETDYKIEYIGGLVGYDDLHNFSHIFKKWQGISPLNYRKSFRII